jgi:hypothetical protein
MQRTVRSISAVLLAMLVAAILADDVLANRTDGTLRDTFYFSPSWDYSVRWYADEWSVAEESSQERADRLVLEHVDGATVRFEGRSAPNGDTRACLDAEIAALEADGAQNIDVIQDEEGRPQKSYHPWRSWILLIAAVPDNGELADQAIFLDCRTLDRFGAVFIRDLRMSAPDFATDLIYLDILNAALPSGAWVSTSSSTVADPGLDPGGWTNPPLPTDPYLPQDFPSTPRLLSGPDGEMGMITLVDQDLAGQDFVIVIENTRDTPLVIDPAQFMLSNPPFVGQEDPDVAALNAAWTDGAEAGARSIEPGDSASLFLHFPPTTESAAQVSLVFWDQAIDDGGIPLSCLTNCGYGGGGSRPKLRAIR